MVEAVFHQVVTSHDGKKVYLSRWDILPGFPAVGMVLRFGAHSAEVKSVSYTVHEQRVRVLLRSVDGTHDLETLLEEMIKSGFEIEDATPPTAAHH